MHPVSRLELMVDSVELNLITAILNRTPSLTYTVIRNVTSHGVRGEETEGGISLENDYIIAFCPTDRLKTLLEAIRPILNKFGGACFVSEATEIKSMRCIAEIGR
jgi:hypothetical protein